jgi:site-specific recombinase XerD
MMSRPLKTFSVEEVVRSLPIELWPGADRRAWIAASQPAERLKRGGAAAHLKPITRDDLARRYGYFLDFLSRRSLLRKDAAAAAAVTHEHVECYVCELKARVGSVTVHGSIYKLRRASELISPAREFTWLSEIEKDLALEVRPRSKLGRWVSTESLVEAGLALVAEAEMAGNLSDLARARQVRNGLMVALLAFCPIRLKNLCVLEIGSTFVEINGQWWIVLAASQTKEKRADERPVAEELRPVIESYLNTHRPVLAQGRSGSALWLSANDGRPMGYDGVARAIKTTTLSTLGADLSPHLFRTAAASTAAMHCGADLNLGAAVLHHTGRTITNACYNRASSASAARSFSEVLRKL